MQAEDSRPEGTPRWVKVFGIIIVVLIVALVVIVLTGRGGGHGPSRHGVTPDGPQASQTSTP